MGKILVIKNADFTENCIENTETWRKVVPVAMPNNLYSYYVNSSNGAYTYNGTQSAYYIEVEAGTLLKIKFGIKTKGSGEVVQERCGFYQTMPSAGSISPLYYDNWDATTQTMTAEHIMEVPFDGIFIISRSTFYPDAIEELFIK